LLTPKHPLLPSLAAQFPFEIAVGMNGRIWFKAADVGQTIAIKRLLEMVEKGQLGMGKEEVGKAVREFTA
jgi:exosome complex component RRP40